MADPVRTTRRATLATMAGVALTTFTQPPAAAAPPFEPTLLGRRFMRHISMAKWLLRVPYQDEAQEDAIALRVAHYHGELIRVAAEIVARPVQSAADLIDRLILATYECDPGWDVERENILPILGGALAAASITAGECILGEGAEADALAAGA